MAEELRERIQEWTQGELAEDFANRLRARKREIDNTGPQAYIRDTAEATQRAMTRDLVEVEVIDEFLDFFDNNESGSSILEAMIDDKLGISD